MREDVNTREGMEIDLRKLLMAYLRKLWLIVLAAVVVGGITLWYTRNYVTPTYRTSVTIYVNNYRSDATVEYISGSNLTASQQLVSTYVNIINSETVLGRVVSESNLKFTPAQIRSMITTQQIGETELFRVYVTHTNPQVAAEVANAIAREALSGIEEFVEGSSAKVVDYAQVPSSHYSPNYAQNTQVGAAIGAVIALLYITLRTLLDVRLRTAADLEQIFDYPVLGQIPTFVSADSKKGYGYSSRKYGYSHKGYGLEANQTEKTGKGGE